MAFRQSECENSPKVEAKNQDDLEDGMATQNKALTIGELKASGYQPAPLREEMRRNLIASGNVPDALRKMQREGFSSREGRRVPNLQELLQRLREKRQSQLDKYQLSSVMNEMRQKLDNILKVEREGIQEGFCPTTPSEAINPFFRSA